MAVLAGGDVAALLMFAAIGRIGHGFSVLDFETFKTADPFIAGSFCYPEIVILLSFNHILFLYIGRP